MLLQFRLFITVVVACIGIIGTPRILCAQSVTSPQVADAVGADLREVGTSSDIEAVLLRLEAAWGRATPLFGTAPISEIHEVLKEVVTFQREAGVGGLPEYSNVLLKEAAARRIKKDTEGSRYLFRKALELSPRSAEVRFNALSLGITLGEFTSFGSFFEAISLIPADPYLCAKLLLHSLYPLAWALTIGMYLTLVVFSFFWFVDLLRQAANFFPIRYRGLLAPCSTIVVLVVPLLGGPIVTLLVWAIFLWIIDRRRKWALLGSAVVLLVWGFLSPIRERLGLWLAEPGNQVLLSYTSGSLGGADRFRLEQLTNSQSATGAAWFAYAQLLRRYGDLQGALKALDAAGRNLPGEPEVASERGVVRALLEDIEGARKDMEDAEKGGITSVEHLYNFSRVAAEGLDTSGSREYFMRASGKDEKVLSELQEREDQLGARHPSAYANVRLPLSRLMGSFWNERFAPTSYRSQVLFFGQSPFQIVVCGLLLLLLMAVPSGTKSRRRLSPYYAGYQPSALVLIILRLVPGGPWAMRQNPIGASILFSIGAFCVMPLIGWPSDCRWLLDLYPAWMAKYFTIVGSATLVVVLLGFIRSED